MAQLNNLMLNKAIKFAPFGRPTLASSRGLWRRYFMSAFSIKRTLVQGCLIVTISQNVKPVLKQIGKTEDFTMNDKDTKNAIDVLNKIMEIELAGVVRYTHYSLMVYGYNRIPIVSWMKSNAQEGLNHAHKAGEMVTLLGGHPSLKIGALLETQKHDIGDILRESLEHENSALEAYYELLKISEGGNSVHLEEFARQLIVEEELHLDEVNKMLRKPGDVEAFKP